MIDIRQLRCRHRAKALAGPAFIAAALAALFTLNAQAVTVSFQDGVNGYDGTQDTMVVSGGADNFNYGAAEFFDINRQSSTRRSLLKFDLSSLAGQFSSIDSVSLQLTPAGSAITGDFSIYAVSDANAGWIQGNKTGALATTGEPAWNFIAGGPTPGDPLTGSTPWAGSIGLGTAGTDYDTPALFTGTYTSGSTTPITVTLPTSLIADWINNPSTNGGLFLRFDTEVNTVVARFRSSEFTTIADRPMLTVDYTAIPEPSAFVLSGLGMVVLIGRSRARARLM